LGSGLLIVKDNTIVLFEEIVFTELINDIDLNVLGMVAEKEFEQVCIKFEEVVKILKTILIGYVEIGFLTPPTNTKNGVDVRLLNKLLIVRY
jgi:hypothetical protein